jgi:hypothetical protein
MHQTHRLEEEELPECESFSISHAQRRSKRSIVHRAQKAQYDRGTKKSSLERNEWHLCRHRTQRISKLFRNAFFQSHLDVRFDLSFSAPELAVVFPEPEIALINEKNDTPMSQSCALPLRK